YNIFNYISSNLEDIDVKYIDFFSDYSEKTLMICGTKKGVWIYKKKAEYYIEISPIYNVFSEDFNLNSFKNFINNFSPTLLCKISEEQLNNWQSILCNL
ncbi:MAG: hypothetical protein LBL93_02415, partial [Ruminococcus sp.]|nr:hypothetical protein [Ruminococcus sp.]